MAFGGPTTHQEIVDLTMDLVHGLQRIDAPADRLQLVDFCTRQLAAVESETIADRYEAGDSDTQVENLFTSGGQTSKAEARKRASRGKAVNANPKLADKMRSGKLSPDQADVIADAANDTDGAAACDDELIEKIEESTPEQGKKHSQDWVTKRKTNANLETENKRQHRLRNVQLQPGRGKGHLWRIIIEGPRRSVEPMFKRIEDRADDEYQADGGRNKTTDEHPRTRGQRMFDATQTLITGDNAPPAQSGKKRGSAAVVHLNVTPAQLAGTDSSLIQSCDGQPLPRSVVEALGCDAEFIGHIYSEVGELLWQGRRHRTVTTAQWNALISRDGGCQQCNKSWTACVAHHVIPWFAPAKGETNIDNLVLLCQSCHTQVHNLKLTMVRNTTSRAWETRPATSSELPGDPPNNATRRRTRHRSQVREKPKPHEHRKQKLAAIRATYGLTGNDPPLL